MGKLVHPCRVKSFRKAVSAVMDDLGIDDKIIENMNLIKIWQLELELSTCVKRFISSRVIRGSALMEMSGEKWLLRVR